MRAASLPFRRLLATPSLRRAAAVLPLGRRCVLASLTTLLAAAPTAAQTGGSGVAGTASEPRGWWEPYDGPRRLDLSVVAGYAFSSSWSDLIALHTFDPLGGSHRQVLLRDLAVAPGAGGEAALTYWRGRHGFRVHAGYSRSCLTTAARCTRAAEPPPADGAALAVAEVPMDVWRYGVQGVAGLRNWNDSRTWRPYLLVGAGGVVYDAAEHTLPLFPGTFETLVPPAALPPGSVLISNGSSAFIVGVDELGFEHVFGATIGIGMDVRVPVGIGGVGVRIELVDQITSSPFAVRVARLDGAGAGRFQRGSDLEFRTGAVHNVRLHAGLSLEFGLAGPRTEHDPWARLRGGIDN